MPVQPKTLESSVFYCFNVELHTHSGLKFGFHVRLIDRNSSPVILFSMHLCHTQVLVPCTDADECVAGGVRR